MKANDRHASSAELRMAAGLRSRERASASAKQCARSGAVLARVRLSQSTQTNDLDQPGNTGGYQHDPGAKRREVERRTRSVATRFDRRRLKAVQHIRIAHLRGLDASAACAGTLEKVDRAS